MTLSTQSTLEAQSHRLSFAEKLFVGICMLSFVALMAVIAGPGEEHEAGHSVLTRQRTYEHGWPWVAARRLLVLSKSGNPKSKPLEVAVRNYRRRFTEQHKKLPLLVHATQDSQRTPQWNFNKPKTFWTALPAWLPSAGNRPTVGGRDIGSPTIQCSAIKFLWVGLVGDILVWLVGYSIIYRYLRYRSRTRGSLFRITSRDLLAMVTVVAVVLGFFANWKRVSYAEQRSLKSMTNELALKYDFTSAAPVWLDRVTDFRMRTLWQKMSFQRGIREFDIEDVSLFDRVKAVRISHGGNSNADGSTTPLIVNPVNTAHSINEFTMLSQIWIDRPIDNSVESLLRKVDGNGVKFFSSARSVNFDVSWKCITHFSQLESLTIESSGSIVGGFVASFPRLKQLTLKRATFDDEAIDEILGLENLEQLVVTKKSLSKSQLAKLLSSKRQELTLFLN